ncbi:MAG: LPS assembly lipoprotein LptE [Akkermansiaceae bacterium]
MRRSLLLMSGLLLTSCAGYHFGGNKPDHLGGVDSICVPLATSRVIFPRIEVITTNTAVDALVGDGTYRLARNDEADATLVLTLEQLNYSQVRSSTVDVLRSEELQIEVLVSYKLIDQKRPGMVLDQGKERGFSRLFVDDNLQTARINALPDALERASKSIIARLADGI